MYSRYFGIGMLKIMELTGQEMDKDEVYPVMEDWMTTQLGKSHITACVSVYFVPCRVFFFHHMKIVESNNISSSHLLAPFSLFRLSG